MVGNSASLVHYRVDITLQTLNIVIDSWQPATLGLLKILHLNNWILYFYIIIYYCVQLASRIPKSSHVSIYIAGNFEGCDFQGLTTLV